jgi:hypothetical protein
MMNITKVGLGLAVLSLSACSVEGVRSYSGPNDYIAVAADLGRDNNSNANDNAGIATTPDGCQTWYIDDGLESRASNRLDPVTGLPVCGSTPNIVYGPYQSGSEGIADRVPGVPVPTRQELVRVRPYQGTFQPAHPQSQSR